MAQTTFGVEKMATFPVASRVNFGLFQELSTGAPARIGGRIHRVTGSSETYSLMTTDNGSINIVAEPGLLPAETADGAFVEVLGTKVGDAELRTVGMVMLPGRDVDGELWDE